MRFSYEIPKPHYSADVHRDLHDGRSGPTPKGDVATSTSTTAVGSNESSESEKLVLEIQTGPLSNKKFENQEPTVLEEQYKSIDWSNAQGASVRLTRTVNGNTFGMSLSKWSTSANQPITMSWTCMENGKKVLKDSPPLASAQDGLPFFLAFLRNDPSIESMTQWTTRRLEFKGPQDYPEGNPNLRKQQ